MRTVFISVLVALSAISQTQAQDAVCGDLQNAPTRDVIIVGAGAAGLVAAQQIYSKGTKNLTVLEARNRMGGRAWTIKGANGNALDMGAQYIHGEEGNAVYQFASKYDLVIDEEDVPGYDTEEYFLEDGEMVDEEDIESAWEIYSDITDTISDRNDHNSSVGAQIQREVAKLPASKFTEPVKRVFGEYIKDASADFGDDIIYESMDEESYYEANEGADSNIPKGGFQKIFDTLLTNVPVSSIFQYNAVVKTIYWQINCSAGSRFNGMSAVRLANGTLIATRYTLVTVPLGVLKAGAIDFVPSLAGSSIKAAKDKATAFTRLAFGCIGKIYIRWARQWWNEETSVVGIAVDPDNKQPDGITVNQSLYTNPDDKFWYRNVNAFNTVYDQEETLEAWVYGKWTRIVESLPESEIQDVLMQLLRKFASSEYPRIPNPLQTIRSQWCQDEFARGTYSMLTTDSRYEDFAALATPLPDAKTPTLLFAGEATNNKQWGTVNAAWQTGFRQAGIINGLLKGNSPK